MKSLSKSSQCHNGHLIAAVRAAVVCFSFLSGGCTSFLAGSHSTGAPSPTAPPGNKINGVPYRLPRVMIGVALVRSVSGVSVVFTPPVYGPDDGADSTYLLQFHPRSSSKDTFNVSVDPSTNLLTSVTGEADDQGAKIFEELGKLAGSLVKPESAMESGGPEILYEAAFDPGNQAEVAAVTDGLNAALGKPLLDALNRDCEYLVETGLRDPKVKPDKRQAREKELRAESPACVLAAKIRSGKVAQPTLWVDVDYTPFSYGTTVKQADCDVGLCTRVLSPARLAVGTGKSCRLETPKCEQGTYALQDTNLATRSFSMPNDSAPVPIELKRAAFAKVNYDIKMKDGLISTSNVTKESEALAIVAAPAKAIDAFFKSLANIVQLKLDLTKKEKELLDAKKDKLTSGDALADAVAASDAKKKERKEAKIESAADAAQTTPYLLVEVPELSLGSGAELVAKGIANSGGATDAAGNARDGGKPGNGDAAPPAAGNPPPAANRPAPAEPPQDPNKVLDGPVAGGGDDF